MEDGVQCLVKSRRMPSPKPLYSYLAAAILALVTLFTFYVFRDFGPQSVLRQFHIDAARGDFDDIRRRVLQPDSGATADMIRFVQGLVRQNASFEIVGMKRQGRVMFVFVEYRLPNGLAQGMVWYVRQTAADWRVDCDLTRQSLFRPPMEPMP
jgi:hypothetical protein